MLWIITVFNRLHHSPLFVEIGRESPFIPRSSFNRFLSLLYLLISTPGRPTTFVSLGISWSTKLPIPTNTLAPIFTRIRIVTPAEMDTLSPISMCPLISTLRPIVQFDPKSTSWPMLQRLSMYECFSGDYSISLGPTLDYCITADIYGIPRTFMPFCSTLIHLLFSTLKVETGIPILAPACI